MIEEQKGKWDGKMSADSMLKEGSSGCPVRRRRLPACLTIRPGKAADVRHQSNSGTNEHNSELIRPVRVRSVLTIGIGWASNRAEK